MEYYNNQLCITHAELTDGIMSESLIKQSKFRGRIEQAQLGGNGREALFAVESLPLKYKTEVYRRFPDMKAQAESKPFVESIEPDGAALNFYETFELGDGRYLPPDKVAEYSNNAAILNTFRAVMEKSNSQRIKQSHARINKMEFWRKAAQALPRIADTFPHSLPENARRLQEKFNQYQREGYSALITGKYGTRNAAKILTNDQGDVLVRLISDYRNFNDVEIADMYGIFADKLGWDKISPKAVARMRAKVDLETSVGRLGASNFHNEKAMQNRREKPSAPLLYWTLDGWDVELYYQHAEENKKGHNVTTYNNRLTMVVVLDPCEMYPVGYAIGTHETPELIATALRDAANHTAELFGNRYRCSQLQCDHYAIKTMSPLYSAMSGKLTPAKVKNAKSKIIEPYFGYLNKKYFRYYGNWSGFGITSDKRKQPNSDALNMHRHKFPDLDGCIAQICRVMETERAIKREAYVSKFSTVPAKHLLPLTDEQYLLNFGQDTGYRNAIEGKGLRPTIEGVKRVYDTFDINFRRLQHIRWGVKYDPNNLSSVLAISEDGMHRFMLEDKYIQPMALADRKEGDAEQLAKVDQFNADLRRHVIDTLAIADRTTQRLIEGEPALDQTLVKAVLCDSLGQHKNRRNTRRALSAKNISTIEIKAIESKPIVEVGFEEENTYELF